MAFYRNVAGQTIGVFAYDKTTGLPKTGDAANITAYLRKDTGSPAATDDTNPTEVDATNMKGWYEFTMTQGESDAERLTLAPVSATANILIEQVQVFTADSTVATAAALATVDSNIDAILEDTGTTLPATLATIDGRIDTEVAAILEDTGTTIPAQITALNNLSAAQVNAEVDTALADYDPPTKAELDAGLAGLNDLDATEVQTAAAAALAAYDAATATQVSAVTAPSAATVADAVWDEVLSGHLTAGSTGAGLNAAGSAGDPWATALPGAYGAGTAGQILGDNLDAAVSSRLAAAGYSAPLDAAGIRAAIGMAAANLDTQLSGLSTFDPDVDDVNVATRTVEGALDELEVLRVLLAALAGNTTGNESSTPAFRDRANTKNRIEATIDGNGNRTVTSIDAS